MIPNLSQKRLFTTCLTIAAIATACILSGQTMASPIQEAEVKAQESQSIELPVNQKTPVFTFNQAGGFRRSPKMTVDFELYADGTIKAQNGDKPLQFKLNKDQLQSFLQFVVNENRAYDFTTKGLEEEMKKLGKLAIEQIADASSAEVKLDLPKGKHEFSVYALFFARKDFEERVAGVKSLGAIEFLCGQLVAKRVLGDKSQLVIDTINAEIKKQGLKIKPVSIKELRRASESDNGRLQASFERSQPNPENTRSPKISISYFHDAKNGKQPVVRVYGLQRE